MRRPLSYWVLLTVLLTPCLSAAGARDEKKKAHPDFSGTWALDRSKSDFGIFDERPIAKADVTLVVAHAEPELKVARTIKLNDKRESSSLVYYTDGRGETNPGLFGVSEIKSKTTWEGGKLVARSKLKRGGAQTHAELELTEKWSLSGDGKTLTYTSTLRGEFGESDVRLVYRRAS